MEKINIAEILKNCPKGMELDCTLLDNVVFEKIDFCSGKYPIVIRNSKTNAAIYLSEYGQFMNKENYKCIIFPKGKTAWEGFVPPCKFKDGDIIYTLLKSNFEFISIFQKASKTRIYSYVDLGSQLYSKHPDGLFIDNITSQRLATEEEKAELFKAIKKSGYKWNAENKTLEELYHYPKTLNECCTVLGLTELGIIGGYRHGLLTQFRNLLICRDAYWKIEGDWKFSFDEECYYLCNEYHEIRKFKGTCDCNAILAFPTEEMRDAFFENFEELINECKSLL